MINYNKYLIKTRDSTVQTLQLQVNQTVNNSPETDHNSKISQLPQNGRNGTLSEASAKLLYPN